MKEMQLSFGISDDWLPGSRVAWNGLLCTSRSPLPILILSHKSTSRRQTRRLRLSLLAADGGTMGSAGRRRFHLQSQTAPLFTHPRPFSNARGPSSSVTKATQWQDFGAWEVWQVSGCSQLKKKGKEWAILRLPPVSPRSLAAGRRGPARPTPHTPSLRLSPSPSFPLHFF